MKNFYGIKLSEPFPFRLYEDCCEMAKYASDNCFKLDELKMAALSEIILDEPEMFISSANTTGVSSNQNNQTPEGNEKSKIHSLYQEIVNFKEDMLINKCSLKYRILKFLCKRYSENTAPKEIVIKSNKDEVIHLEKLYNEFCRLLTPKKIKTLTRIHSYLSEIVSPATASTILFTKPTVKFPFTRSISTIPFMRNLMLCTIISFLVFIVLLVLTNIPGKPVNGNDLNELNKIFPPFILNIVKEFRLYGVRVSEMIVSLSAAALGAYFYSLYTANRYFIKRTFERKYVTYYNIRIVVGMISGFVLSNFIMHDIMKNSDVSILNNISFILIALLGGYSAEVVMLILKKIMTSIIIIFKGDPSEVKDDLEQEYKAKTDIEISKNKNQYFQELIEFSKLIPEEVTRSTMKSEDYQKIVDNIRMALKNKINDF